MASSNFEASSPQPKPRDLVKLTDPTVGLSSEHRDALYTVVQTVLATEIAEETLAHLADGLPTFDLYDAGGGGWGLDEEHPLRAHTTLCDGATEKAREFLRGLSLEDLTFQRHVMDAYREAPIDSRDFNIRLLEILAVSIHQIGAKVFTHVPKCHTAERIEEVTKWRKGPYWRFCEDMGRKRWTEPEPWSLPPTLFSHDDYRDYDIYPLGIADVAGYWAEDRILGGVVLFDRGQSGFEAHNVFLHPHRATWVGPFDQIWRLCEDDIVHLAEHLLGCNAGCESVASPFPLKPDDKKHCNRLRPWEAIAFYHICRDPWDRKVLGESDYEAPCVKRESWDYMAQDPLPEPDPKWLIHQGCHIGTPHFKQLELSAEPLDGEQPPEYWKPITEESLAEREAWQKLMFKKTVALYARYYIKPNSPDFEEQVQLRPRMTVDNTWRDEDLPKVCVWDEMEDLPRYLDLGYWEDTSWGNRSWAEPVVRKYKERLSIDPEFEARHKEGEVCEREKREANLAAQRT